jgi:succinyl-diaminopimelate desuccinylase
MEINRLVARTMELIDIPSVSRYEAPILELIASLIPSDWSVRHEPDEWVVAGYGTGPGLILAGHVDTVPEQGNLPARISQGVISGLGASDMKGGLAVMLEVADWMVSTPHARVPSVTLIFFAREEISVAHSPLDRLLSENPAIAEAELAVMLEPTDCVVEVGCLGNILAVARFDGIACHSARPWQGCNAVHSALPTLARVADAHHIEVDVSGYTFTESVSVVGIEAGLADNVVPDTATARVNYRYSPARSRDDAEARIGSLLEGASHVEILSHASAAAIPATNPLLEKLVATTGEKPRAKIAWTPVAEFASAGLDAVNFGPGSPLAAHRADEWIDVAALERCFSAIVQTIRGG